MIYLFNNQEKLIKIVRKNAVRSAYQTQTLTDEHYVSDKLEVELNALNDDELNQIEYMAIPFKDDKTKYHLFFVARQETQDNITVLTGVQSGIEELRKTPIRDRRPNQWTARQTIEVLLQGTNWSAQYVADTGTRSTNFYYVSVFDALKKVCDVWQLEMRFIVELRGNEIGARYIEFKQKIGKKVGSRVVYGHNALQILQEVEKTELVTAMIGRGKALEVSSAEENESGQAGYGRKITFEDVVWTKTSGKPVDKPLGQDYVELPELTAKYGVLNGGIGKPKIGFFEVEEEDPERLLERTYQALIDKARPQVTFKTSTAYINNASIGDTVRVVRHDRHLDYDTRIFEIQWNRLNDTSADIKLGDKLNVSESLRTTQLSQKIEESIARGLGTQLIQYIVSADGKNTNWHTPTDPNLNPEYRKMVRVGDIWYQPDPEFESEYIMTVWTGELWKELVSKRLEKELDQKFQTLHNELDQTRQDIQTKTAPIAEQQRKLDQFTSQLTTVQTAVQTAQREATAATSRAEAVKREADGRINTLINTTLPTELGKVTRQITDTGETIRQLTGTVNTATGKIRTLESNQATYERDQNGIRTNLQTINATIASDGSLSRTLKQYAETKTADALRTIRNEVGDQYVKTAAYNETVNGINRRFESIRVGGRNYILNSNQFITTGSTQFEMSPDFIKNAIGGKTVIVSIEVEATGLSRQGTKTPRLGSELRVNYTDGTYQNINCWLVGTDNLPKKRYSNVNVIPEGKTIERIYYPGMHIQLNGNVTLGKPQVEISGIETDWVPALEDGEAITTQLTANYNQLNDSFGAELEKREAFMNGDWRTYTAKVNTNAEEITKRLTRTQVDTLVNNKGFQTATQVANTVKATADSFTRTIETVKATIPTEMGGANLLKNSSMTENFDKWGNEREGAVIVTEDGMKCAKITGEFGKSKRFYQSIIEEVKQDSIDQVYTLSADIKIVNYVAGTTNPYLALYVNGDAGGWMGGTYIGDEKIHRYNNQGWKRVSVRFKYNKERRLMTVANAYVYTRDFTGSIYFKNLKLERGNIATDWTPAPEDIEAKTWSKTEISMLPNGLAIKSGSNVNGQTLASMISVEPQAMTALTDKMVVQPFMENLVKPEFREGYTQVPYSFFLTDWINGVDVTTGDEFYFEIDAVNVTLNFNINAIVYLEYTDRTSNYYGSKLIDKTQRSRHVSKTTVKIGDIGTKKVNRIRLATNSPSSQVVGTLGIHRIYVTKKKSAELIVDGSITSKHLAAGSINADRLNVNEGFIDKLETLLFTTDKLTSIYANITSLDSFSVNVDKLTGNKASLISAGFRALNSSASIDGTKIQIRNSDNSYVEMNNIPEFRSSDPGGTATVMGNGRTHYLDKHGTSLGYIGMNMYSFDYNGSRVGKGEKYGVWLSRGSGGFSINYMQDGGFQEATENKYYRVTRDSWPTRLIEDVMRYKGNTGNWGNYEWVKAELSRLNNFGNWPWPGNDTWKAGDLVILEKGTSSTYIPSGYRRYLDCTVASDGKTHTVYTYTEARFQENVIMQKILDVRGTLKYHTLSQTSDRRLKTNIAPTELNALDELNQLNFVQFDWKTGGHEPIGLIAQDSGRLRLKGETETINTTMLLHMATKAIQELSDKVDVMQKQIEKLEGQLNVRN